MLRFLIPSETLLKLNAVDMQEYKSEAVFTQEHEDLGDKVLLMQSNNREILE